jgi:hypothetical protein
MSDERPETCPKCHAPVVWCACEEENVPIIRGYYFVNGPIGNVYLDTSLLEIVEQLESCSYRCEAGPLSLNLAFQELKRRAIEEKPLTSEGGCTKKARFRILYLVNGYSTYACADHLTRMTSGDDRVSVSDIQDNEEICCFMETED